MPTIKCSVPMTEVKEFFNDRKMVDKYCQMDKEDLKRLMKAYK